MTSVSYRPLDDGAGSDLLSLNRACPLESQFTFRFDREPDFFAWPRAVFERFQYRGAYVDGGLAGYCMAGYRTGWTGTHFATWGYVGDLRVHPDYRGRELMQPVYDQLVAAVPADADQGLFIINQGNAAGDRLAKRLRLSGVTVARGGTLEVVSLPLLFARGRDDRKIREARREDSPAVAALLRERSAGRLFAPRFTEDEIAALIASSSVLVAETAGQLRGVIAWTDLTDVRRTTILRYPGTYAPIRAAWSIVQQFSRGMASLPRVGAPLRTATVTHLAAREDDRAVIRALVTRAMDAQSGRGIHLLQFCGMTGEPSLQSMAGLPRFRFRSDVWLLSRENVVNNRAMQPPYIDLRII